METKIQYGQWLIEKDMPPIPSRDFDWLYVHDDYDGPEDNRCGRAGSVQECIEAIENHEQPEE